MGSEERLIRDAAAGVRNGFRRLINVLSFAVDLVAAGQVDESGARALEPEWPRPEVR